ncbi:DinB family protein [Tunturiibacter gelidiferens]|uniref:DinB family protein n=1 Tax=Tunturiibacter gelidiferens TaxID=3069689 RepID=UPI003D9BA48D
MSQLKELLLAHTGYSAWGTQRVLDACATLTPEQLDQELGVSHSSILRTFRHIHDGERVWLRRLVDPDNEMLPRGTAPEHSFEFLVRSWPEVWDGYRRWLDSSSEADLTLELLTVLPDGGRFCVPRWQIVLHAINHCSYHRGQIVTMLRGFGVQPPNTDLTAYYATR